MDNPNKPNNTASKYILVLNTCPDLQTAESIANILVDQQLAACVNIVPGVISVYQWKGQVEKEQEALLIAKTRADKFSQVTNTIKTRHPYELPEVISVPINDGLPEYLSWIDDNVAHSQLSRGTNEKH